MSPVLFRRRITVAYRSLAAVLILLALTHPCTAADPPTRDDYRQLADEIHRHFDANVLRPFFPRSIDRRHGGFFANYSPDWTPAKSQDRFLVFQSRMTWVAAQVALRRPDLRDEYRAYARHGLDMLRRMEDPEQGGLFWGLDESGKIDARKFGTFKHAYALSFGVYAAAAVFEATGDQAALDFANKQFDWFDRHAHDDKNGGYFESLNRDGTPIRPADLARTLDNRSPGPDVSYGYKSMNSHIHLLESLTALYHAGKDPRVRQRLEEVFLIVRDRIAVEPGCLNQFFTPDWRAVPDFDSFGHDIETTYLLLEASETLGRTDEDATMKIARRLLDHALDWGFDWRNGGFYDKGAAFEKPHGLDKVWWTQAEGLNSLLLMHQRFGQDTDRYWKAFQLTWHFVNDHMTDQQNGGWYSTTDESGKVTGPSKANDWKACYHDGRALMNMEERLRRMAGD